MSPQRRQRRFSPAAVALATATVAFAATLGLSGWAAPPRRQQAPHPKPEHLSYNRDIRPILSAKCFSCHGQDGGARQAGLRLDRRTDALMKLASGGRAIVPGNLQASELIARITAVGKPIEMPPADSHKILTAEERALLTRWVAQGASYEEHWAFVKPQRPALPAVRQKSWPKNSIDYFVLAKLEKEGLRPAPEADRATLLRRVSLDLTGLPPTPAEVDRFLADRSPNAYEKAVDRLLASPRYGEHMAAQWMDLARYADSNGYQADYERFQWRWRDWVIDAFNRNMPYDRFTVEQIAGDMLPNATVSQKIATGFNRNHRINTEGGVIPEEWRVETVIDRVETTSAVWLGVTTGCARCHDHKYDPITQRDFYRLFAYFNNVPETGSGEERPVNHPPFLKSPTPDQEKQMVALDTRIKALDGQMTHAEAALGDTDLTDRATKALQTADQSLASGMTARLTLAAAPASATMNGKPAFEPGHVSGAIRFDGASSLDMSGTAGDWEKDKPFSYGCWVNPEAGNGVPLSRMDAGDDYRGWDMYLAGNRLSVHIIHKWPMDALKVNAKAMVPSGQWSHIFVTYDGSGKPEGIRIYVNGQPVEHDTEANSLQGTIRTTKPLRVGGRYGADAFKGRVDDIRLYDRVVTPAEVADIARLDPVRPALAAAPTARTQEQRHALARFALQDDAAYRAADTERAKETAERAALDNSIPTTMVMQEMPNPRDCFVLLRGEYDKHGEKVTAALPPALGSLPPGAPNNRLGLARWIASPDNPLTARVAVNRFWERLFGIGIVATSEDFGVRAEYPSHPELLDWMATEFVRLGWDMKAMQREIVLSATYRQSSRVTPALLQRDPANRLLARGPRLRLPAESVRDQALYAAGLLVEQVGGPSVRPYQPDGVWDELSVYGNLRNYKHDMGSGLYRRSLYTIWKRTVSPPLMSIFDVPGRDTCRVRRARTDTPLQSLALLNDETFVEASRVLAEHMIKEGGTTPAERVAYAYRKLLCRRPTPEETKILTASLSRRLARYQSDQAAAEKLVSIGDVPRDPKIAPAELAAYTLTASVVLNLDETITKE